jgi:chorismate mutase
MPIELHVLREEITHIDYEILTLLTRRMKLAEIIADYKKEKWLPIFDPVREREIIEGYSDRVDFDITGIYQAIMDESKRIQENR